RLRHPEPRGKLCHAGAPAGTAHVGRAELEHPIDLICAPQAISTNEHPVCDCVSHYSVDLEMPSSYADMYLVSRGAAVRTSLTSAAEARRRRFEQIYAANHAAITGYVLRRTDNPDDAADVIAETFLTCWRRLGDVPDGDSTRLWLYGVARRVLANH